MRWSSSHSRSSLSMQSALIGASSANAASFARPSSVCSACDKAAGSLRSCGVRDSSIAVRITLDRRAALLRRFCLVAELREPPLFAFGRRQQGDVLLPSRAMRACMRASAEQQLICELAPSQVEGQVLGTASRTQTHSVDLMDPRVSSREPCGSVSEACTTTYGRCAGNAVF